MVYFIADPHFGHENAIKLCSRPFETVEEMNETIIKNWNGRVHGNDTVYIVGDIKTPRLIQFNYSSAGFAA